MATNVSAIMTLAMRILECIFSMLSIYLDSVTHASSSGNNHSILNLSHLL